MVKQQTQVLAGALVVAPLFLIVALWFVVGGDPDATTVPSWPALLALPAAGVVVHVVLDAVGYRTRPIAPGTPEEEARAQSVTRWQSAMMLRFAISEAIAIVSIALCFLVREGGYVLTVVGCLTAVVLILAHVFPWSRPVTRFAASLEKDGARSGLREAFGFAPRAGGAIQEL